MTKDNLNLPKTSFSMKANLPQKEPGILNFWDKIDLYKKKLKVYFLKFIRRDIKFKNSTELIRQMNKDVYLAKKGLNIKLEL